MGGTPQAVRTFDIEGQEVRCYQSEGHRLWRCECPAFQRRLSQRGEGFCAHTAVAIMRLTEEGSIGNSEASGGERGLVYWPITRKYRSPG